MGWLKKSKSSVPKTGGDLAKCILCRTTITAHKRVILMHSQSERHKYNLKQVSNTPKIESMSRTAEIDMQVRRAELKLCCLLATNNLSFSLMDTLSPLMGNIINDSAIAKQIAVRRTKATNLVKNALGPFFENSLTENLRLEYFSIIMDETTDRSTIKQCAFTVIFCDGQKILTKFFDMVEMESGSARDLFEGLKNVLINKKIPIQNLVGFSADTTNVMFGENQSVVSLLKNELPNVVCIKCSCHMIHLATSKACLKLPRSVEDLLRNVGSHFSRSYARVAKFKDFQMFFQTEIHKILLPSHTRWLSLKACVDRVLEQYVPLKEYFRESVFSDPSKTTEEMLVTLDNEFTHIYLEFMSYVLGLMTDFNILFQSESPLLHLLKPECEKLLKTICSNFIDIKYLRNIDIFKINHKNTETFSDLDKVYVGISAHESIILIKMKPNLNRHELETFYKSCQHFYIELVSEIKQRFDFSDSIFDLISIVEPSIAQSYNVKSLGNIFERFPYLKNVVNAQDLDNEWKRHALEYESYNLGDTHSAEDYWSKLFAFKNSVGYNIFPNLKVVINLLMILPFSNASVERVFSMLQLTKTNQRNRLETNTLKSIFFTKEGVSDNGGCLTFEPCMTLLSKQY